jgi:hypothetical protein
MRRLAWLAVLLLLTACATDRATLERNQRDRDTALLKDARECEEDADDQLRAAGQDDPGDPAPVLPGVYGAPRMADRVKPRTLTGA